MASPFVEVEPQPEQIPRDEEGKIISGCAFLFPDVITQQVLEEVAGDPEIEGVLLKDPSGKFRVGGTEIKLLKNAKWHLTSDEMFLSRILLFGNSQNQ